MPEWLLTAIVAAIAASGAWFTSRVTGRAGSYGRIRDLEGRVDLVERRNQILWNYNRQLIDHIYQGSPPPPPVMPDGII
ncbi:hypothetical protein [Cryobacterium sp. Y57]|uniref:hypothetical protein n=1 Tax=Cryobacterium sp. Y57 TaxID=2048287 RepID=UPI000CE2BDD8|nr:hypothetical protein [Cryobacterium sp. Y57]